MSRKSTYKQVLSIGTAVVLGFALFTDRSTGAKLLSPQSNEQAAALAEKQNESPSRTEDEAGLVARLESGTASSEDSGDGSESAAPDTGDAASEDSSTTPSARSKTPTLTAPAAYTSAAFPTTPATPTLPFAPTARTRSARHHSHSMNTIAPPKRAALRNSPSSTARPHFARRSPAWALSHSVKKRRDISRIHPAGWHQQRYDFIPGQSLYKPLPPYRPVTLRRERQSQESPHRHALSQRDGYAAV